MSQVETILREQLVGRREKLVTSFRPYSDTTQLYQLLREVDAALLRLENGSYGLCQTCHDPIEPERLLADPLACFCLDHLTPRERQTLERDLATAAQVQSELLPKPTAAYGAWQVARHYEAAGPVSGDYCDLISLADGSLFFTFGDVSGKGVTAALLMTQLHAMFRALISLRLPLAQLMERASSLFCESTLPMHYATLVCGQAHPTGALELCNAGHLPPLWLHSGAVRSLGATGLPLGIFGQQEYSAETRQLSPGDALLLYTDGISEALNDVGDEYGSIRLAEVLSDCDTLPPQAIIANCLTDLRAFQSGAPKTDDLTLMALRWTG